MSETVISLKEIKKSYGKHQVLNGVDLDINKGDIFGLVGKNGAGKTTIFKIILGLSDYQSGKMQIGETGGNLEEGRKKIGFFVGFNFFPYLTGKENLEYYRQLKNIPDKGEAERVLKIVELDQAKSPFRSYSMPKEFDHSQIGFSTGRTGSVGYDRTVLDYTVSENEITGAYNGILFPYEGLTARIELPEGYFVRKRISDLPAILLLILVPLISLLVIFILWFRYGKDRRVTETVEFYPPEHMKLYRFRSIDDWDEEILKKGDHYVRVKLNEVLIFVRPEKLVPVCSSAEYAEGTDTGNLHSLSYIRTGAVYRMYDDDGEGTEFDLEKNIKEITEKNAPPLR